MTTTHQATGPPLTLDSFGLKMNARKLSDHSTSAGDGGPIHTLSPHIPLALRQAGPDPCSRQVPVELLHWVVEDFVGAGEGDLGGPLGDRRLLGVRWALFAAGRRAVLHGGRTCRPVGRPLHKPSTTQTAGGAKTRGEPQNGPRVGHPRRPVPARPASGGRRGEERAAFLGRGAYTSAKQAQESPWPP